VRRLRVAPQALAVLSEQILERRVIQHRFSQQFFSRRFSSYSDFNRRASDWLIPKVLSASNDELTEMMLEIVSSLYAFMLQIDDRIKAFDRKIGAIFKASDVCRGSPRSEESGRKRRLP